MRIRAIFFLSMTLAVSNVHAESLGFSLSDTANRNFWQFWNRPDLSIQAIDDVTLLPLSDVKISISDSLDSDLRSFSIEAYTDSEGFLDFFTFDRTSHIITASKEGYTTFTLAGVRSKHVTFFLKPIPKADSVAIIQGGIQGWDPHPGKKYVQAGVVFKSLNAVDVIDFQTTSFFSPLKDIINVMGSREIPSNLVLPNQDVTVLFATVNLNKPVFRLPLLTRRNTRLAVLEASGKATDIMSALQGGNGSSYFSLLNQLSLSRIGLSDTFQPSTGLSKTINADMKLVQNQYQVHANRPPFAADVVVVSMIDQNGDRRFLYPTDIKTASSLQDPNSLHDVNLSGITQNQNATQGIVTVALGDQFKQVSGILSSQISVMTKPGDFLNVALIPDYQTLPQTVNLTAPAHGIGMLSFYQTLPPELSYPVWTVAVLPTLGNIQFSTQNLGTSVNIQKYSVTQLEFGASFNETIIDGQTLLKDLNRFGKAVSAQSHGEL